MPVDGCGEILIGEEFIYIQVTQLYLNSARIEIIRTAPVGVVMIPKAWNIYWKLLTRHDRLNTDS